MLLYQSDKFIFATCWHLFRVMIKFGLLVTKGRKKLQEGVFF